jgi:hypothetical protein
LNGLWLLVWSLGFNWSGLLDDLWWLLWEWLNGLGWLVVRGLAFWAISFRGGGQESGGLEFWEGGGGQQFSLTFSTFLGHFGGFLGSSINWERGGGNGLTFSTFLGHFSGLICSSINWESSGGNGLAFSSLFGDIRSRWGTGGWDGGGLKGLTFGTDFRGGTSWGEGGSSKWGLGFSLTFEETTESGNRLIDDALWSGGPG